jgi:hypothetical protein
METAFKAAPVTLRHLFAGADWEAIDCCSRMNQLTSDLLFCSVLCKQTENRSNMWLTGDWFHR